MLNQKFYEVLPLLIQIYAKIKIKSTIKIISRSVICTIDSSSSNRPFHSELALGGRLTVKIKKGLAFSNVISTQSVSMFEISISCLRLQLIELRVYKVTPPPALFCVSDLSLRTISKSSIAL